jgi:30S ribosomal protein S31
MGRGDKRSRRGKIFKGSYGNTRTQKTEAVNKPSAAAGSSAKKAPVAKKGK